jgi:hypothetical protein
MAVLRQANKEYHRPHRRTSRPTFFISSFLPPGEPPSPAHCPYSINLFGRIAVSRAPASFQPAPALALVAPSVNRQGKPPWALSRPIFPKQTRCILAAETSGKENQKLIPPVDMNQEKEPTMNYLNFIWGGAALGVITAGWGYIKAVLWKVCNLFIRQVEIHNEACAEAVIGYLIKTYRRSRLYDCTYSAQYEHLRNGKYGMVPFEYFGKRSIIFWNWCFPFFFDGPERKTGSTNPRGYVGEDKKEVSCTLTYVRGTLHVDRIISNAANERNAMTWNVESENRSRERRFFIKHVPNFVKERGPSSGGGTAWWFRMGQYRLLAHSPEELGKQFEEGTSSLDSLIFPQRIKDLINEIRLWRKHRQWYVRRNIPWKRGWLLYGPPGTGKTALARAFAEDLDMPIHAFNLAETSNYDFMRAWSKMQQHVPCIALIEDIDNVFNGRENVAHRRGGLFSLIRRDKPKQDESKTAGNEDKEDLGGGLLNFDVFLNCLDGVERSDGVFTIITTNDISKIDSALGQPRQLPDGSIEFISTRPGRIDKAIELGYMEPADKRLMARKILGEYEDACREMLEFIERFADLQETPAQFQERCAQIALHCFWQEQEAAKRALEEGREVRRGKRGPLAKGHVEKEMQSV